jgi:DnaA-homolog protein
MQAILSLDLPFKPLLADVREGSNGAALHAARRWCAGAGVGARANALAAGLSAATDSADTRFVLTWGAAGTGKTMLAQALCGEMSRAAGSGAAHADAHADAHYNAGSTVRFLHPASPLCDFAAAMDAPQLSAVVVDNIHALNHAQAVAAFNLYNHIRDAAHGAAPPTRWWATSRVPPSHMTGVLPDLASRMAWGLVFELLPLADADSIAVLQAQAARLGFALSDEAAQYLLLRLERNLGVLAQHMDSLNRYALTLKKPVTAHLVQQWYATVYCA